MRQLYLCKNLYYYDYYPLLALAKTFYVFPTLVYFEKYLSSFAERFMAFLPIDTTKSNPIQLKFVLNGNKSKFAGLNAYLCKQHQKTELYRYTTLNS